MRLIRLLALCLLPSTAVAQPVQLLHRFTSSPAHPNGPLLQVPDGSFYGLTTSGIIRLSPGGAVADVARIADGTPAGALVRASDGALYGTTADGGPAERGTVFRFDPATGDLRTVHAFTSPAEGSSPLGGLVQRGGSLYGVTHSAPGTFDGMIFHVVVATGVVVTDRAVPGPAGPLVAGPDGLLYGASTGGGSGGGLYRFDPAGGTLTMVHAFLGPDGSQPKTLTLGSDGSLYGNAIAGGLENVGTLFRYTPATDRFERLHSLAPSNGLDGFRPGPLVQGGDGHFYGITDRQDFVNEAGGSLFRLRAGAGGTFTYETLRVLDGLSDGLPQQAALTLGADGLIYGSAIVLGPTWFGTLFRFDPLAGGPPSNPTSFSVLHTFPVSTAWGPSAPVPAADGFLYGLTRNGGSSNRGAVYRLAPATGAVTILGALPGPYTVAVTNSALVPGPEPNGLLYGTSTTDVPSPSTAIIRVDPATGTATVAVAAIRRPPYSGPVGVVPGLTRTPAGQLYGVAYGGPGGFVYRFDPFANAVTEVAQFTSNILPVSPLVAANDGRVWMAVHISFGPPGAAQKRPALLRLDASSPSGLTELPLTGPVIEPTGLAQGTDGRLYVAGGNASPIVVRADPATGMMTTICTLPPPALGGPSMLSAGADGAIYGVFGGGRQLFRCDPSTGQATLRTLPADVARTSGPFVPLGLLLYGASSDPANYNQERFGGVLFRLAATGQLPALDTDGDTLPSEWETAYGLDPFDGGRGSGPSDDPDGDGRTNAQELADGTHPRGFVTRLFAEGASNGFFRTRFDFANPFLGTGLVRARFLGDSGATLAADLVVPAQGHFSLDPSTLADFSPGSYSLILESDQTLAIDRTMTWGAGRRGSHLETALRGPSTTWYFAEGSTSGEFALFYLLQNPETTAVSATVRWLRPSGLPPVERTYMLPPASRTTIVVDDAAPELQSTDVSAVITSTAPIVAERAMYLSRQGQPFRAGHESAGVVAPALDWFLAEGATGGFFDLFVLIANPSPTAATIDVEYLRGSGAPLTKRYAVPAQSRVTIWVDAEELPAGSGQRPLADGSVSTAVHVTNGVPVVVERTMWWPGPAITADFWYETHNSPGATGTALQWAIGGAEIAAADEADTYVLIANTADRPGRVQIQTLFDGPVGFRHVTLPAKSRTTVSLRSMPFPAAGVFGVLIESIAPLSGSAVPVPIVVERATYASPGGVFWETGGNALATPLP